MAKHRKSKTAHDDDPDAPVTPAVAGASEEPGEMPPKMKNKEYERNCASCTSSWSRCRNG